MTPEAAAWWGAVSGGLAGAGALFVLAHLRGRRIRLDDRLAPYLRPRGTGSSLLAAPAGGRASTTGWGGSWIAALAGIVGRHAGDAAELELRLARAGRDVTVEQFRATQVVWGVSSLAGALAVALLLAGTRGASPVALAVLVMLSGVLGALVPDRLLGAAVRRRDQRILLEFPTVAELLALAVGAGESPLAALDRVSRSARGELPSELGRVLAEIRAGVPLAVALDRLADRASLPVLTRFAEGVSLAIVRGTPLADVLRAHAQDVREAGKQELIEGAGRKEVLMMVPVVFLILPVTVVFAVFPSLVTLRLGP